MSRFEKATKCHFKRSFDIKVKLDVAPLKATTKIFCSDES